MPKFSQELNQTEAPKKKGLDQAVVDQFKPYIEKLEKNHTGRLEFGKTENIAVGRKALDQAGVELKKYIKVRKPRGSDNVLEFQRITRKEYVASKASAKARGAKLKSAKVKAPVAPKKTRARKK
jgi:hypothetical protein